MDQVARIPAIDRCVEGHDKGLLRLDPYRRHIPRRWDRAGLIRGSDPPPLDGMSIDRQGHPMSKATAQAWRWPMSRRVSAESSAQRESANEIVIGRT
jgi:hypothetical protein